MKLITNSGDDRVVDQLRRCLIRGGTLDLASPALSLFAFGELDHQLAGLQRCRVVVPLAADDDPGWLLGGMHDRARRNRLQNHWLARRCARWLAREGVRTRGAPPGELPQSLWAATPPHPATSLTLSGACPFTTEGLGLTPGHRFGLIQATTESAEREALAGWFDRLWQGLPATGVAGERLLTRLRALTDHQSPSRSYLLILHHLFRELGEQPDEERIVKSATGIRETVVWRKPYRWL